MKYAQQFVTTSLNVGGGINDSQTTGIVLQSLNNIDATKPSVACISWADPLSTSVAEWITYTSINSTTNELNGVVRGAEGYSAKTHSNGAVVAFPYSKSHINEVNDSVDTGWVILNETLTYASATTITIAAGGASRYQKGDKLKLTQTTVKYFYVVTVADTLLTITGGTTHTLADAAITSPYLSRISNPFGFPNYFNYAPILTYTGGTTDPTSVAGTYRFTLNGTALTLTLIPSITVGAGNRTSTSFTLPITYASGTGGTMCSYFAQIAVSYANLASDKLNVYHAAMTGTTLNGHMTGTYII